MRTSWAISWARLSDSRKPKTRSQPASARRLAMVFPKPRDAPVTSAVRFARMVNSDLDLDCDLIGQVYAALNERSHRAEAWLG